MWVRWSAVVIFSRWQLDDHHMSLEKLNHLLAYIMSVFKTVWAVILTAFRITLWMQDDTTKQNFQKFVTKFETLSVSINIHVFGTYFKLKWSCRVFSASCWIYNRLPKQKLTKGHAADVDGIYKSNIKLENRTEQTRQIYKQKCGLGGQQWLSSVDDYWMTTASHLRS